VTEALEYLEIPLEGTGVAVQGFGNVGQIAARLIQGKGAKIVLLSDSRGGVYNPSGLDVYQVAAFKQDMRVAAYMLAVARTAEAGKTLGEYP
jgi:glutamate dehydrogenase/leucine dehydrogenase